MKGLDLVKLLRFTRSLGNAGVSRISKHATACSVSEEGAKKSKAVRKRHRRNEIARLSRRRNRS